MTIQIARHTIIPAGFMQIRAPKTAAAAAAGWWVVPGKTCVAAYQPKGAASYAASLLDLSGSGNDAAEGVAPTWTAGTGWTFNGTTQYLTTGVIPVATYSMAIQFVNKTSPAGTYTAMGEAGANAQMMVMPYRSALGPRWYYGNSLKDLGLNVNVTDGNLAMAASAGYLDGAPKVSAIGAWTGVALELCVACENAAGGPWHYCALTVVAVAIYSDTLTDGEMATLCAAMAAL